MTMFISTPSMPLLLKSIVSFVHMDFVIQDLTIILYWKCTNSKETQSLHVWTFSRHLYTIIRFYQCTSDSSVMVAYLFYILVWHMSWLFVQVGFTFISIGWLKLPKLNFRSDRRPFHSPSYIYCRWALWLYSIETQCSKRVLCYFIPTTHLQHLTFLCHKLAFVY